VPPDEAYHVAGARLSADLPVIHDMRRRIFIAKQQIPGDPEWDGLGDGCSQALAFHVPMEKILSINNN
jgi:hypothetical protein